MDRKSSMNQTQSVWTVLEANRPGNHRRAVLLQLLIAMLTVALAGCSKQPETPQAAQGAPTVKLGRQRQHGDGGFRR